MYMLIALTKRQAKKLMSNAQRDEITFTTLGLVLKEIRFFAMRGYETISVKLGHAKKTIILASLKGLGYSFFEEEDGIVTVEWWQ